MTCLGFVTCLDRPDLSADDALVVAPLRHRGVDVIPVPWDAPAWSGGACDALVMRSCWNYHLRPETFAAWLDAVESSGAPVWNHPDTVRWNMHKAYLVDLARRGVNTVPTRLLRRGADISPTTLMEALRCDRLVIKPAVSASAHRTWIASRERCRADADRLSSEIATGDLIAQPFLEEIHARGEWSLVCFDGAPSHAVLKRGAPGEFRVREEHGGSVKARRAPEPVIETARRSLSTLDRVPVYARVDVVETGDGALLMELELIEPSLFLGQDPEAPDRFATALAGRLHEEERSG